jgi:DDE superfamily endonuclease
LPFLPGDSAHRAGCRLTDDQRTVNLLHAAVRAPAERGNSLLKTTFKALRRVSLCPWRIGAITAAALVLLHHQHGRTTRSAAWRAHGRPARSPARTVRWWVWVGQPVAEQ